MSAVEVGGCAPPVHTSSAPPVDVLAVLDAHVAECAARLNALRKEIAGGDVSDYAKELADTEGAHRAAVEARVGAAALIGAADRLQRKERGKSRVLSTVYTNDVDCLRIALARCGVSP